MAHDVFISYSNKDKPIADAVCASLESAQIRSWIAPRDIAPGEDWPTAISNAISQSRVMVLVFSSSSNSSEDVGRELVLAANSRLVIIPFKIENVQPEPGKQYYLARTHWLDAVNPPTREQIRLLVDTVKTFVARVSGPMEDSAAKARKAAQHVQENQAVRSVPVPAPSQAPVPPRTQTAKKRRGAWLYSLIPLALLVLGGTCYGAIRLGTRLLAGPASPTFEPTASRTAGPTTTPYWTRAIESASQPTATRNVVPTEPTMDVNIIDGFLWNAYDWPILQNANDTGAIQNLNIANGQLTWSIDCLILDGCYYFYYPGIETINDFDVSVDVKRTSFTHPGHAGLTFRIQDETNYYMFAVDDTARQFLVWRVMHNSASAEVEWTRSDAIRYQGTNTLAVSARGNSFTFFINGEEVAATQIVGISRGHIGIEAQIFVKGTMTVAFDNFELHGSSYK